MQFAATYAPSVFDYTHDADGAPVRRRRFSARGPEGGPERIWCYAAQREQAQIFADDVSGCRDAAGDSLHRLGRAGSPRSGRDPLSRRPRPRPDAWNRREHGHARAWSLCGVTHSLSSLRSMSAVASLVRAPLYPWDAVICTSTVARDLYRSCSKPRWSTCARASARPASPCRNCR